MFGLERCTVVLEGILDGLSARRVAEALSGLRPGGALRIDLTNVREVQAVGLAELARLLNGHHEPLLVRVLGLREQDRRMLAYLGVELDAGGGAVCAPGSSAVVH